jgi:hypothetical protein
MPFSASDASAWDAVGTRSGRGSGRGYKPLTCGLATTASTRGYVSYKPVTWTFTPKIRCRLERVAERLPLSYRERDAAARDKHRLFSIDSQRRPAARSRLSAAFSEIKANRESSISRLGGGIHSQPVSRSMYVRGSEVFNVVLLAIVR